MHVLLRGVAQGRLYPLVLLDGRMPNIDGLALAAMFRQQAELSATRLVHVHLVQRSPAFGNADAAVNLIEVLLVMRHIRQTRPASACLVGSSCESLLANTSILTLVYAAAENELPPGRKPGRIRRDEYGSERAAAGIRTSPRLPPASWLGFRSTATSGGSSTPQISCSKLF
jgi:CheY-like chemotaxis protein